VGDQFFKVFGVQHFDALELVRYRHDQPPEVLAAEHLPGFPEDVVPVHLVDLEVFDQLACRQRIALGDLVSAERARSALSAAAPSVDSD